MLLIHRGINSMRPFKTTTWAADLWSGAFMGSRSGNLKPDVTPTFPKLFFPQWRDADWCRYYVESPQFSLRSKLVPVAIFCFKYSNLETRILLPIYWPYPVPAVLLTSTLFTSPVSGFNVPADWWSIHVQAQDLGSIFPPDLLFKSMGSVESFT